MEFVKLGKRYLIKGSNLIIDEKEKLEMEKKGLILEDITGKGCQGKTTKKISKINKKLKEIEETTKDEEIVDDPIEETNTTV